MNMTSNKPYLVRAFHEWITDNELTPYLMVDARYPGVRVPDGFVDEEGRVVFNISWQAVQGLELGNEAISFSARFSGAAHSLYIPVEAVMAVYARENGAGTMFEVQIPAQDASATETEDGDKPARPAGLRLVKD